MFDRNLKLPKANSEAVFQDAATALKQEFRNGSRVLKLLCRKVEQRGDETSDIFRLDVAGQFPMNWTWEGASAWRPDNIEDVDDTEGEQGADEEKSLWKGEVLEIDADKGHVYVSTGGVFDRAATPCQRHQTKPSAVAPLELSKHPARA